MTNVLGSFELEPPAAGAPLTALAVDALTAVIDAGAKSLIAQPWRVARIIRGADVMTFDELSYEAAKRRRARRSADLNRAIAQAQLEVALKAPRFSAAWAQWRDALTA